MGIPEMAEVIAEYVAKYHGKSKEEIEQQMNDDFSKNGHTEDDWDEESPVPQYADDVSYLLKRFDGKGKVEIEDELNNFDERELDDIHVIVDVLSKIPDFDDEDDEDDDPDDEGSAPAPASK